MTRRHRLSTRAHRARVALLAGILLLSFLPRTASAQDSGVWKIFLYGNEVQDLATRGEEVWAATTGGAVRLSPDGRLQQWNRELHGLLSDSVNVVETDESGQIWFGTLRAGISVFQPETDHWRPITSIPEQIPGDEIRRIRLFGEAPNDTVLVGTVDGYVVMVGGDTRSTCFQGIDICGLNSYDVRDLLPVGNEIWLATAAGAVVQKADGSWEDRSLGLSGIGLMMLARADSLYAAGEGADQIFTWRGDRWAKAGGLNGALPGGSRCRDLLTRGDTLWTALNTAVPAQGGVFRRQSGAWTRVGSPIPGVTSLEMTPSGKLHAGASDPLGVLDGIWRWTGSEWIQNRIDGPGMLQHYRSIQFDADGAVWLSAATSGQTPRILRYDGDRWSHFLGGSEGRLNAWTFRILDVGADLWVGHCCCRDPEDVCRMERIQSRGELFTAWPVTNAADLDLDERGDIWAATYHDAGNEVHAHGIYRIRPSDSTFVQVTREIKADLVSNQVRTLRVDGRTVWIGYYGSGVSRWDLGPDEEPLTSDDRWKAITATHDTIPIIGNDVRAMAIGPDHRVWIGTTAGLSIWDGTRFTNIGSGFGRLPTPEVTAVVPTDDGGAWVGTRDGGLTRMSRRSLGGFTYRTYGAPFLPHLTIEAMSFAPDGRTLWLATARGLASFAPPRDTGTGSDEEIGAYPNPFTPGCVDGLRLTGIAGSVSGVVADLSGKVLTEFPGGGVSPVQDPSRVIWDGRAGAGATAWATPGLYWIRVRTPQGTKSIGVAVVDGDCPN